MSTADPFDTPLMMRSEFADPFDEPIYSAPEPDPFDTPAHDPVTGELFDEIVDDRIETGPGASELLPFVMAQNGTDAVELAAKSLPEFVSDLRAALDRRLVTQYEAIVKRRPAGKVTADTVQPELAWFADAHDVLTGIGGAFADAVKGVRQLAGDVVIEASGKPVDITGGSTSVKVGTGTTAGVKLTTTQATEAFANDDEIVDVLVVHLVGENVDDDAVELAVPYAAGARDALRAYRELVSPPTWKTTALDALRMRLAGGGPFGVALAGRLAAAYGRRVKSGSAPSTKIERVDLTPKTRKIG